jgi:hypothetical protein
MHRIDGAGATVDNKFTDGDPVGGIQATLVTDDWLNDVQEELMSILAAGAVTPVKGTQNQVLRAIRALGTGVVGSTVNLKMTVSTPSATATITADEVVVKSGLAGRTWTIGSFNKLLNLANAGALGMDVGPAPVNGWLAIYAGLNEATGATTAFAQSVGNAFAPAVYGGANAPVGITATALLTVVPTNASAQFKLCAVRGRKVAIQLASAYSGNASVVNNPISIAAIVPANAIAITHGELQIQNTAQSAMSLTVAPDATYIGQQNIGTTLYGPSILTANYSDILLITPQQIMFTSSSTAGTATYNIHISGYSI